MPGIPSFAGGVFTFGADPVPGQKRWYGARGNTYTAVINFAPKGLEARSILVLGQTADPASPHHTDQASLCATQRFKPAWYIRKEVRKHSERTYRP